MKSHRSRFFAAASAAVVTYLAVASHSIAQETNQKGDVDTPPGPFASWSEDFRKTAEKRIVAECAVSTSIGLRGLQGDQRARTEATQALSLACVVNKMPADWPFQHEFRKRAELHAQEAHRIDPGFEMPVLKPKE
jgi:hypothetical protein